MSFEVQFHDVADSDLGPLLAGAANLGYTSPSVRALASRQDQVYGSTDTAIDLVARWQLADRREGQAYQWPETLEHYDRYEVYQGETQREGMVFISLGWTIRGAAWGMDRLYAVSFLTRQAPQTPLAEFLAADDYADTRELIAVIRGSDGGRRMYGPKENLPPVYAQFRIVVYRDRVQAKGAWNKLAVVAGEVDTDTILNHALIQARRRRDL